jgi:hypothetical protein
MALKFNLANQLMGPEQMAGFGQSFGESIGGMGLALNDAWSKYQEEQDRAASIVDPATGRVPLTLEAENMDDEFYEDIQVDDVDFESMQDWEEPGAPQYIRDQIDNLGAIKNINIADGTIRRVTPNNNNASDIKNMDKIPGASTESIATQEDKDTYIKEHGIDAYNALVEKRFRMADPGISSGVGFQRDRRELTKFGGNATNLLGAVNLQQDLSKVQNPINYNPETEYNFQQGLKPNIFGTALNNLGR